MNDFRTIERDISDCKRLDIDNFLVTVTLTDEEIDRAYRGLHRLELLKKNRAKMQFDIEYELREHYHIRNGEDIVQVAQKVWDYFLDDYAADDINLENYELYETFNFEGSINYFYQDFKGLVNNHYSYDVILRAMDETKELYKDKYENAKEYFDKLNNDKYGCWYDDDGHIVAWMDY